MKIYIVFYEYSNYDEHSYRNIKGFLDKTAAELFMLEYAEANKKNIENNQEIDIKLKKFQFVQNGIMYRDPEYCQLLKTILPYDDIEYGGYHIEELEVE